MNLLVFYTLEIEGTSHCLLHCHHFILHPIDFMNSVKSICNNIAPRQQKSNFVFVW